nr:Os06g0247651 [Ipomoea batatas]GMC87894.1 Os06g0247651 [Ipomoea batatas]GMC89798.1 Os06g0247651 [Ipomoea batatas]
MWISLKQQLILNSLRQYLKKLQTLWGQFPFPNTSIIYNTMSQNFIQFCNELLNLQNEIYKPFWYEYDTIIVSQLCTFAYHISNVVSNVFQSIFLCKNLHAYQSDVWMCLQGTL